MKSLVATFEKFDAKNPHIYNLFKRFALEVVKTHKRFSADAILHRIRWFTQVETVGSKFKIANYCAAFYARKFIKEFPQYEGIFSFRKSAADDMK